MNKSTIWVKITTHQTNLDFTAQVKLNGDTWHVQFANTFIKATSSNEYEVPGKHFNRKDRIMDAVMNQIVGHLRNVGYIAMDEELKWGYEGGYQSGSVGELNAIFPSIHQDGSSQFFPESIERAQRIIKDIGSSRKKGLRQMLNYWRRATELDDLGFESESFLNYFKVLECLAEVGANDIKKRAMVARFSPSRVPQTTLQRRYSNVSADTLHKQILFAAKVLSAIGRDEKVSRDLFIRILDGTFVRHNWNVAHKLVRKNPYDEYNAIGQHSDEFNLVMIENIHMNKLSKYLILNYVKPGQYWLDGKNFTVKPKKGLGSK